MWWFWLCTRELRWQPWYFLPQPMACYLVHCNQDMMQLTITSSIQILFILHLSQEWIENKGGWDENCSPFLSLVLPVASSPGPSQRFRQNDVVEQSHEGGADETWDGHCDEPGHEDVSEETPVYGLLGAQPADSHHWADLKNTMAFKARSH